MTNGLRVTATIVQFELHDIMRSRWLIGYGVFFLALTDVLLRFGGSSTNALLSLMNVVLFVIPLVSVVFTTVYLYHIREFTELVATQPVKRRHLFAGLHLGVALPLIGVFLIGLLAPFLWHGIDRTLLPALMSLAVVGVLMTAVFVAVASVIAVYVDDRLKALGLAVASWLLSAVLYDGLVLFLAMVFADYPLEPGLLALMVANPVDVARVVLLMQFDVSALMGYTGALFRKTFAGGLGLTLAIGALALWITVPMLAAARRFARKDF